MSVRHFRKRRRQWQIFAVSSMLLAGLTLVGCAKTVEVRGHVDDPDALASVQPGVSTKDDVLHAIGSPSATSEFGRETWYYISAHKETKAFLDPKLLEQEVMQITFDQEGKVDEILHYDKDNAKKITAVKDYTPTEGRGLGLMEQLLSNVGRFNNHSPASGAMSGSARRPY